MQIDLENHHFGEEMKHLEYHPVNLNYDTHIHRSFELWFCEEGYFSITIDEINYSLKKNEILLILPFQSHSIQSFVENKGHIWIFSPEHILDFYHQVQGKKFNDPVLKLTEEINQRIFEMLFNSESTYLHRCALYYVLSLYESNTSLEISQVKDNVTEKIASWFSKNYDKNKSLIDISKEIGYSKDYISKIIADRFESNFSTIMNQYRINRACYLLNNTDYSITEISNMCGFQNMRTFNRNFLKLTKTNPRLYRESPINMEEISRQPLFLNENFF